MLEVIRHGVGDPWDFRSEGALGFRDVHQALVESDRVDVAVEFGVRQRLIQVDKPDALRRVISIDRLQPGDVADERRSSQAAVDDDGVLAL